MKTKSSASGRDETRPEGVKHFNWNNDDPALGRVIQTATIPHKAAESATPRPMPISALLYAFARHHTGQKDGPAAILADLPAGPRKKEYVRAVTALGLDLDDGIDGAELDAKLEAFGVMAVRYTTHSHTAAKPKHRVVFPLAEDYDVTAEGEGDPVRGCTAWARVPHAMGARLGVEIDSACVDPARAFFLPRRPKGAPHEASVFGGPLLDWRTLELPPLPAKARAQKSATAAGSELRAWVKSGGGSFQIADALDNYADEHIRARASDRLTAECPFDHLHSNAGATDDHGFFVRNAGDGPGEGFVAHCAHNHCSSFDRLDFLAAMVEAEWLPDTALIDSDFFPLGEVPTIARTALEKPTSLVEVVTLIDGLDKTDSEGRAAIVKRIALLAEGDQEIALAALRDRTKIKISTLKGEVMAHGRRPDPTTAGAIMADDGHLVLTHQGDTPDQVEGRAFLLGVVRAANDAGPIYTLLQGGLMCLERDSGRAVFASVSPPEFKSALAKRCSFARVNDSGNRGPRQPPNPYLCDLVYHGLESGDLPKTPEIRRAPTMAADGSMLDRDGWHDDVFVALGDLKVPPIPDDPTQRDVDEALDLLLDDLLVDFPFYDKTDETGRPDGAASRANALAMLLTSYMRDLFTGLVPMFGIDKPKPGTGGTELAQLSALLLDGEETTPWRYTGEDELQKETVTKVRTCASHFLLDNADDLQSQNLMMALTAGKIGGRALGQNKTIEASNTILWIYTGNNVSLHEDLIRRVVRINLNTLTDDPKDRAFKKRADADGRSITFKDWVKAERGELIAALLTLIRFWVMKGRPLSKESLPSYEGWSRTVGGVLEAVGANAFLTNPREAKASRDTAEVVEFVTVWAAKWATDTVTEGALFDHVKLLELGVLKGWRESDQRRDFGRLLDRLEGRTFTVEGSPRMAVRVGGEWLLITPPKRPGG